jgi:hypothetical protein
VPAHGMHLATLAHDGKFWDVYLELEEPEPPDRFVRGRFRFSAPGGGPEPGGAEEVRTAFIFLDDTADAVSARARSLHSEQVMGLLRSCLP